MAQHDHGEARRESADGFAPALAQGLGWFSIGLGLAELVAPRSFARPLGMEEHTGLVRACGAREIATGVGILRREDPTPWIWARVGGDALDLAALASGLRRDNPKRGNVGLALAAVAGIAALDVVCARALARNRQRSRQLALRHYRDRSGLPRPPEAMRGAARDFEVPRDMRAPEAMRPFTSA